ncbi:MAG: radical SAM protein [Dehalococcoidia bacterium]|nr:radical SAM protein [Dehalococcoidia bacterium]
MRADNSSSFLTYELPPIRPPSEARSLLIRVMRGCPWNYCTFCSVYKDLPRKNMLRSTDEVKGDIDALRASADELRAQGYRVEPRTAFLADSNAVIIKTEDLIDIIAYLRAAFPSLERVTSYARAKTLLAKDTGELRLLHDAGLDRLHVGLESGDDGVLATVKKGATAREMTEGGRKAKEAGFELSLYIMPGLGGTARSADHIRGTVDVLNAVDPDFIRVRPLQVVPGTPLFDDMIAGAFEPLSLVEMLEELRHIVAGLQTTGNICFDHFMNAPIFDQSWEGYKLPESKEHLLTIMDEALASAARRK